MIRRETRGRARALQLLYAREITGRPLDAVLTGLTRLTGPAPRVMDFAEELVQGVLRDGPELDRRLAAATDRWRLERLAVVDRNILRLAGYELLHDRVPARVAIDEALWLAHRFGTPESPGFINGVLDRVARDLGRL